MGASFASAPIKRNSSPKSWNTGNIFTAVFPYTQSEFIRNTLIRNDQLKIQKIRNANQLIIWCQETQFLSRPAKINSLRNNHDIYLTC